MLRPTRRCKNRPSVKKCAKTSISMMILLQKRHQVPAVHRSIRYVDTGRYPWQTIHSFQVLVTPSAISELSSLPLSIVSAYSTGSALSRITFSLVPNAESTHTPALVLPTDTLAPPISATESASIATMSRPDFPSGLISSGILPAMGNPSATLSPSESLSTASMVSVSED